MAGRIALGGLFATLAAAAAIAASADAASRALSQNWAGYVVVGDSIAYTSVTGTWRLPTVGCGPGDAGASSGFWVGLGGFSTTNVPEQIGTSAECDAKTGMPSYYAWYELGPNSTTLAKFAIGPGDLITTSVNVVNGGKSVMLQIKDRSRGTSFTTTKPYATPDLSSAEWITEAPSACNEAGTRCRQLTLANFGSVQFTRIAALGNGTGGTLNSNPLWRTVQFSLVPAGEAGFFPGRRQYSPVANSSAGANATLPTSDGRSFTVKWSADAAATS
jgi:hypothetical protein